MPRTLLTTMSQQHHMMSGGVNPVYRCSCGKPLANTMRLALLAMHEHKQAVLS